MGSGSWPSAPSGPPARPSESLKTRAVRGTLLSVGGLVISMVIRLGANIIMTRLLAPEAYGLMALMVTLEIGFRMFSDVGTRVSIIQNPRGEDRAFLDTAFTVEILRGVVMWLAILAATWPYAEYCQQPELKTLLPVFSLGVVIGGFTSTKYHLLRRQLRLGRVMTLDIGEQLVAAVVTLAYAVFVERSVWALVVGGIAAVSARVAVSFFLLPGPMDRFAWDKDAIASIRSFGGWIFVSTAITFFAQRLDILMMPRLLTIGEVGVYNIASQLAAAPMLLGSRVTSAVLLPALSEAKRESAATFTRDFSRAMNVSLMTGGVACLGVALGSPFFFWLLYTEEYAAAQWLAPLMVLTVWFSYAQECASISVQALGSSKPLALANLVKLLGTGLGAYLGYTAGGLYGFVFGTSLGALSGHAVLIVALKQLGMPAGKADLWWTLVYAALAAGGVLGAQAIAPSPEQAAPLTIATAAVLGIPTLAYVTRRVLREVRRS